jgi:GNAT superfamily N-acetyltransferase
MEKYSFSIEPFEDSYPEVEPLYREHYAEMKARLDGQGTPIPDYKPRLFDYVNSSRRGDLFTWVVRIDGEAVGYCNIYLTNDMHNGQLIATEDAIFVTKSHRNGVGRRLVKHILAELKKLGVKRVVVTPVTDLGVEKVWARMGFKTVSSVMVYML